MTDLNSTRAPRMAPIPLAVPFVRAALAVMLLAITFAAAPDAARAGSAGDEYLPAVPTATGKKNPPPTSGPEEATQAVADAIAAPVPKPKKKRKPAPARLDSLPVVPAVTDTGEDGFGLLIPLLLLLGGVPALAIGLTLIGRDRQGPGGPPNMKPSPRPRTPEGEIVAAASEQAV